MQQLRFCGKNGEVINHDEVDTISILIYVCFVRLFTIYPIVLNEIMMVKYGVLLEFFRFV